MKKGTIAWHYLIFLIVGIIALIIILYIVFKTGNRSNAVVDTLKNVL